MNHSRSIVLSIMVALIVMMVVMEYSNGILFFIVLILAAFLTFIGFVGKFQIKWIAFTYLISTIALWLSMIYIFDYEGLIAKRKLEIIIEEIKEFKKRNNRYPDNLRFISVDLQKSYIGIFKRPINKYEFNDFTFIVGWDYNNRVYFDSGQDYWINSLTYKK